jgi:hypothetical protein
MECAWRHNMTTASSWGCCSRVLRKDEHGAGWMYGGLWLQRTATPESFQSESFRYHLHLYALSWDPPPCVKDLPS